MARAPTNANRGLSEAMSGASHRKLALLLLAESDDSSLKFRIDQRGLKQQEASEASVFKQALDIMFRHPTKRPNVACFVDDVVRQYSNEEFPRHFRLPPCVATELIAGFAASPMCPTHNHGGMPAKSAEAHILCFIWGVCELYAANKTCMWDVAHRFDMAESTVYRVLHRVAEYLLTRGPTILTFPDDLEKLSTDFEKSASNPHYLSVIGPSRKPYMELKPSDNVVTATRLYQLAVWRC
ncbi:hypothetical protein HPB49_010679 [Dermacentor silvarum]|uniref:Uncharacterized protein n=1 Tax=Dermacentor silvarum TaxID=543639 RepID=A0ACB8DYW3_DERSI|nr:hypothetical protein HPB49_010679 [Dermacentor silvarum]